MLSAPRPARSPALSRPAPLAPAQQDGFADDTVRLVKQLRAANPDVQVLEQQGRVWHPAE